MVRQAHHERAKKDFGKTLEDAGGSYRHDPVFG